MQAEQLLAIEQAITTEPRLFWLRKAITATAILGIASLGVKSIPEVVAEAQAEGITCEAQECHDNILRQARQLIDSSEQAANPAENVTNTSIVEVPTTTTTTIPPLNAAANMRPELVTAIDPRTEAAINAMSLSPEGYRNFLASIDQSYFDYAQQFREFNPNIVPIHQGKTEFFVWHFTAFYRNLDGPSPVAYGEMLVPPFIEGLANNSGDKCCGVNWLIDRRGYVYQLAPFSAKLRHNPPYDSVNTGVEIEATTQGDITSLQYEALVYLTIANLQNEGLLGSKSVNQAVVGHGEKRDILHTQYPEYGLGHRNDFDAPVSQFLRNKIDELLFNYPELPNLTTPLR